ncbi:glycosyl transferase [Oecophyllibacter saccharovorans]|uniref:glycosyl transferase n=1 Tax=Oecophyllibacter saccharovorans TaxID=2558360 RepID=UPI00116ECFBD|nr:glycosyl transferase [Oecophyllibacter saccharovorans]TPW36419.1 glycosyl transferase [Oecophyllibacter saccharovorans]
MMTADPFPDSGPPLSPPVSADTGRAPAQTQGGRLLVTGSDARYFPLLQELIASIRRLPDFTGLALACVDGGLTPGQIRALQAQGIPVSPPHIPDGIPPRALRQRPSLAIGLSKLWLDRLFPEAGTILWLDADAWVQEASALELLFSAAETQRPAIGVIAELFTHKPFRVRWTPFGLAQIRSILYKNASLARLPRAIQRQVGVRPTLNGGIFSLARQAPHWEVLRHWQKRVLRHGKIFASDQLSIGLCVYADHMEAAFLPGTCNYMGPWYFDPQRNKICQHLWPHHPASIIHLAGHDDMRLDLKATTEVMLLQGGAPTGRKQLMNLRYASLQKTAAL